MRANEGVTNQHGRRKELIRMRRNPNQLINIEVKAGNSAGL